MAGCAFTRSTLGPALDAVVGARVEAGSAQGLSAHLVQVHMHAAVCRRHEAADLVHWPAPRRCATQAAGGVTELEVLVDPGAHKANREPPGSPSALESF